MANPGGGDLDTAATSRLVWLLRQEVPIIGRPGFPELHVVPWRLLRAIAVELASRGVVVHDMRLEGSAAALILNPHVVPSFNDLDLVVHLAPASPLRPHLEATRAALLSALAQIVPNDDTGDSARRTPQTAHALGHAYLQNMFIAPLQAPAANADAWSLFTLCGAPAAPSIDVKFVQRLQHPYQFSIDSFQVVVDPVVQALYAQHLAECSVPRPLSAPAAAVVAEPLCVPPVRFESAYGRAFDAVTHLARRRLVVHRAADLSLVHGGGLLKYALLLASGFSLDAKLDASEVEHIMCARFLRDYPPSECSPLGTPVQLSKLCAFMAAHTSNVLPGAHTTAAAAASAASVDLPPRTVPADVLTAGLAPVFPRPDTLGVVPSTRATLFLHHLAAVLARVELAGLTSLRMIVRVLRALPLLPLAKFAPARASEPALSAMFDNALWDIFAPYAFSGDRLLTSSWLRHVPSSPVDKPPASTTATAGAATQASGDRVRVDKSTPRSARRRKKPLLADLTASASVTASVLPPWTLPGAVDDDGECSPTSVPPLSPFATSTSASGSGSEPGPSPSPCWLDDHYAFFDDDLQGRSGSESSTRSAARVIRLSEHVSGLAAVVEIVSPSSSRESSGRSFSSTTAATSTTATEDPTSSDGTAHGSSSSPGRSDTVSPPRRLSNKVSLTLVESTAPVSSDAVPVLSQAKVLEMAARAGVSDYMFSAAVAIASAAALTVTSKRTALDSDALADKIDFACPRGRLPTGVPSALLATLVCPDADDLTFGGAGLGDKAGSNWSLNSLASGEPGTPWLLGAQSPKLAFRKGFSSASAAAAAAGTGATSGMFMVPLGGLRRNRNGSLSRSLVSGATQHVRRSSLPLHVLDAALF